MLVGVALQGNTKYLRTGLYRCRDGPARWALTGQGTNARKVMLALCSYTCDGDDDNTNNNYYCRAGVRSSTEYYGVHDGLIIPRAYDYAPVALYWQRQAVLFNMSLLRTIVTTITPCSALLARFTVRVLIIARSCFPNRECCWVIITWYWRYELRRCCAASRCAHC